MRAGSEVDMTLQETMHRDVPVYDGGVVSIRLIIRSMVQETHHSRENSSQSVEFLKASMGRMRISVQVTYHQSE